MTSELLTTLPLNCFAVGASNRRKDAGSARSAPADEKRLSLLAPITFLMPYSHHSHSGQFCKHATGSLEDVVKEASNQGFEIYGLTEHAPRYRVRDLYPEEVMSPPCPVVVMY